MIDRYSAENTQVLMDSFIYNPETGDFFWSVNHHGKKSGSLAGSVKPDGYLYLKIGGISYLAHRVAWMMIKGRWPEEQIDHINMIRSDCRFENLRESSISQNNRNRTKQSNNTSGYKGVSLHRGSGKYHARISKDKKCHSLGYFETAELASKAYLAASQKLHEEFSRA